MLSFNSNIITNQQTAVEDRRLEYLKEELVTRQMRNSETELQLRSQMLDDELASLEKRQSALIAANISV